MKPARQVPAVGQVYRSRDGRVRMRIERIDSARGRVHCRYVSGARGSSFVLPLWFLSSFVCGWRLSPDDVDRSTGNPCDTRRS